MIIDKSLPTELPSQRANLGFWRANQPQREQRSGGRASRSEMGGVSGSIFFRQG